LCASSADRYHRPPELSPHVHSHHQAALEVRPDASEETSSIVPATPESSRNPNLQTNRLL